MIKCAYCGKEKEETIFVIGACKSDQPDWCMIEGTGKMSCPECYPTASADGQDAINKHVNSFNKR